MTAAASTRAAERGLRIGELAERLGVSRDTLRFYEKAGWLPRPQREGNGYRSYRDADVEHLRLLIDLRRLELPLDDAARLAAWCHAGHCGETTTSLPALIAERRGDVARRIEELRSLDRQLERLAGHLADGLRDAGDGLQELRLVSATAACCDAAAAVRDEAEGTCACCAAAAPVGLDRPGPARPD